MIRMGTIWDRSVEVMRGRSSILTTIAALTIFLPAVVRAGIAAYAAPGSPGAAMIGGLATLVTTVIAIFGGLALIAVASDPATDSGRAYAIARARLLPAIGLSLLLLLGLAVLLIPAGALLVASGIDFSAAARGETTTPTSMAPIALLFLYMLVAFVVMIWLAARLSLFNPVIVNERAGIATFARSWTLTRGLTWRIIGVFLLFGVVVGVTVLAVQLVSGLVFALLLGQSQRATALFLAAVCVAVVTTVYTVVQSTFLAQLYNAVTGREAATAFE